MADNAIDFLGLPVFRPGLVTHTKRVRTLRTLNLRIYRVTYQGQAYDISFVLASKDIDLVTRAFQRYVDIWESASGQFSVPMLQTVGEPAFAAVISASAVAAVGTNVVTVTPARTMPVDRFISFAGHSKIYAVKASAAGSITVKPNLLSAVSAGETVNYLTDSVLYRGVDPSDTPPSLAIREDGIGRFDVSLVENL